jgi:hypothetical protein
VPNGKGEMETMCENRVELCFGETESTIHMGCRSPHRRLWTTDEAAVWRHSVVMTSR